MELIYLVLGFLAGVGTVTAVGVHKFLQYKKQRDIADLQERACMHQEFKEAVLEAALRGAGGPVVAQRDEYYEM